MTIAFVSDLHLSEERPDKLECFQAFVEHSTNKARAVYILGDLFEVWLGDDDDRPPHPRTLSLLRRLVDSGVALFVALGNRDFLLGKRFCQATGARLLGDWETIDLYGRPTLLTHGDLLCTKDVKYQRFRRTVRNPLVKGIFLSLSLQRRSQIAEKTRDGTQASMAQKDEFIMDVEQETVVSAMSRYQVSQLIHGHTHRPGIHEFGDAKPLNKRIVLGDWYEQDSVGVATEAGFELVDVETYLDS
ncbi:MAG: UDP-2,3-diacylglucosamine diphosphatase [Pseudomonadota bacterium]